MSIFVPYKNVKSAKQAYKKVAARITAAEFAKWNVEAELIHDKENNIMRAVGSGFEVIFEFTETEMIGDAKMGFLLKPFKNKILSYLEQRVKKVV